MAGLGKWNRIDPPPKPRMPIKGGNHHRRSLLPDPLQDWERSYASLGLGAASGGSSFGSPIRGGSSRGRVGSRASSSGGGAFGGGASHSRDSSGTERRRARTGYKWSTVMDGDAPAHESGASGGGAGALGFSASLPALRNGSASAFGASTLTAASKVTTRKPSPVQRRALRWREARWLARVMRQSGKRPQLGLDRLQVGRGVKRNHFVAVFSGYLKIDPFILCPHLNQLFSGFVKEDGLVDPNDMQAVFGVLSKPHMSIRERKYHALNWFESYGYVAEHNGEPDVWLLKTEDLVKVLAVAAVSEEEAQTIVMLSERVEEEIGLPLPPIVTKDEFEDALLRVPELLEVLHEQCLRRLDDDERMRVLHEEASRLTEIVDQHEAKIKHQQAVAFVKNIMNPRKLDKAFYNWRARSDWWRARRLAREAGSQHFKKVYVHLFVVWWRRQAKFQRLKPKAIEMQTYRMKRKNFRMWVRYWKSHAPIRRIKERYDEYQFNRKLGRAQALQDRIAKKERLTFLTVCFAAIIKEGKDARDVRRGAEFYFRWVKKDRFRRWTMYVEQRRVNREQRQFTRDTKVREVAEAEEKEKEEAAWAEEQAKKAAKQKEREDKEWREHVERTEAHFEMKRMIAEQKRAREEFHAQAMAERMEKFEVFFADIKIQMEKDAAAAGQEYLDSPEGQKWLKKEAIPEVMMPVGIREDLTEEQKKAYNVLAWPLVFDHAKVTRKFVHRDTGQEYYAKDETDVPVEQRLDKSIARRIAEDNFISRRVNLAQGKIAKRREKEIVIEDRNWKASIVQRTYRRYLKMKTVREKMREMITLRREMAIDANKKRRQDSARKIQHAFRSQRARRNLLALFRLVYHMRTDPETGETYWYNALSGTNMKHAPAIMTSALTGTSKRKKKYKPDWIFIRKASGLNYYRSGDGEEETHHKPKGYHYCIDCNEDFGTKHCVKCGDRYCDSCFIARHNKGTKALHQWEPVEVKKVQCYYCSHNIAEVRCDDCEQPYCEVCTLIVHGDDVEEGQQGLSWHSVVEM